jgi:hypothetical protein
VIRPRGSANISIHIHNLHRRLIDPTHNLFRSTHDDVLADARSFMVYIGLVRIGDLLVAGTLPQAIEGSTATRLMTSCRDHAQVWLSAVTQQLRRSEWNKGAVMVRLEVFNITNDNVLVEGHRCVLDH